MRPLADIDAIRQALGLTPEDEETVRDAAASLERDVPLWVETFYARLLADPVASSLLVDPGTVERLRRSLSAWFREMFSLPLDAAYERARAQIGRTHVRVGMPMHLMVTAMSGLRTDVRASCRRAWVYDPCRGERVANALERVLDLELALMLGAYGRHSTELAQRRDRALLPQRVARRFAVATRNGVDAAICYAELVARAPDVASRERWLARLRAALDRVGTLDRRWSEGLSPTEAEARPTDLEALVLAAVREVSVPASTTVDVRVEPRHLTAHVHPGPLRLALIELLQNAVNHDPGGTTTLELRGRDGDLVVEVVDGGPGWPPGAASVADLLGTSGGMGLAYGEHVAELHGGAIELFHPPSRGAGVRLRLGSVRAARVPSP